MSAETVFLTISQVYEDPFNVVVNVFAPVHENHHILNPLLL